MRGKYSLHQGPPTEATWDERLVGRQFGWQGGARKQPQWSSEQSILSYHIYIVQHNIHYQTQRPELVDLCCCYRMFAGLWIGFTVPWAHRDLQQWHWQPHSTLRHLTALFTPATPKGKGSIWGDNSPPGIFILPFEEGGIFDFPPLCGWSSTQGINVKRGSFSCFLQSVRFGMPT